MRVSKIAFVVAGLLFLALGVAGAVWGFTSDSLMASGLAFAGLSVGFVGVVFLFVARYFGKLDTSRLIGSPGDGSGGGSGIGVAGTAQVLSVQDTGVTVNNLNMVVKVGLLISVAGRPPYQAEIRHVLRGRTEWGSIQPGMTVPVKVDPQDPSNVAIDTSAVAGAIQHLTAPGSTPSGAAPRVVTRSAADIIAAGIKADGTLISAAATGLTAGQAAAGLPADQADDPIVHVAFTYRLPGEDEEIRGEALIRVPDGKSHVLVPGSTVPIAVLPDAPSTAAIDWSRT
jgi:hypothetical protein